MNKGKSLWLLKSVLPGSFCLQGVFSPWGSSAPQEEGILANSPTNLAAMLTWDRQSGDIKLPCSMDTPHKQHTSMGDGAAVLAACSHLKCVKLNDPPTCCEWPFLYLPNPGIKSASPALQANSLLAEPPGEPTSISEHNTLTHAGWMGCFFNREVQNTCKRDSWLLDVPSAKS